MVTPPAPKHSHTQLTPILLKGLKRDNPARTYTIHRHRQIFHICMFYAEKLSTMCVCQRLLQWRQLQTKYQSAAMCFNYINMAYRSNLAIRSLTIT